MKRLFCIMVILLVHFVCKGQNSDTLLINPFNQFKGSEEELKKLCKGKLTYPIAAKELGIEGTVRIGFTLKKNGKIKRLLII
jgi:hypothetical protein